VDVRIASLGPGIPDADEPAPMPSGHCIPADHHVVATRILGGLQHVRDFQQAGHVITDRHTLTTTQGPNGFATRLTVL
jgi:hypothetical protein